MKVLEYSFYRIYKFQKLVGNHSTPIGTAMIGLIALLMFNFFSLLGIINYFTGIFILFFNSHIFTALLFFIIILLIVLYSTLYKKKYVLIINRYSNETKKQKQKGNFIVFVALLLTLLMLYFSLYLIYSKNV